jgi:hypothetical protein
MSDNATEDTRPETPPEETAPSVPNTNLAPAAVDDTCDVELPSGLSGRIRRWAPKVLRFFTNRQTMKRPGPVVESEILKATWVETYDRGPYTFEGTRPPWMAQVLSGDTTEAVRQGRMFTWGNSYPVDFICESQRCDERIPHDQDLSELEMIPLDDEAMAGFQDGNKFSWRLPDCKREIIYRLPTGQTRIQAAKLSRKHGLIDEVGWASVTSRIEGVTSAGLFVEFYGDLSPADSQALETELNRLDCGVKTKVELVCSGPVCGLEQTQELRFGPNFYKPRDGERDLLG